MKVELPDGFGKMLIVLAMKKTQLLNDSLFGLNLNNNMHALMTLVQKYISAMTTNNCHNSMNIQIVYMYIFDIPYVKMYIHQTKPEQLIPELTKWNGSPIEYTVTLITHAYWQYNGGFQVKTILSRNLQRSLIYELECIFTLIYMWHNRNHRMALMPANAILPNISYIFLRHIYGILINKRIRINMYRISQWTWFSVIILATAPKHLLYSPLLI